MRGIFLIGMLLAALAGWGVTDSFPRFTSGPGLTLIHILQNSGKIGGDCMVALEE